MLRICMRFSLILPLFPMNIILWNCRRALNPRFHLTLSTLINTYSHFLVIITETRVGGDRAKDITERLPFDGAIHLNTIGYSGGIWLLWNSDAVEIMQLAKMEQKIYVMVKVCASDSSWLLSSIYTSPRLEEMKSKWNNLVYVASLHHLPWLMLRDYSEHLSSHDKLGETH